MYICEACGTDISIHALREESDLNFMAHPNPLYISIHALREESDDGGAQAGSRSIEFQSTPSARRATEARCAALGSLGISIHALREESDIQNSSQRILYFNFNPRPPRGERPLYSVPGLEKL